MATPDEIDHDPAMRERNLIRNEKRYYEETELNDVDMVETQRD